MQPSRFALSCAGALNKFISRNFGMDLHGPHSTSKLCSHIALLNIHNIRLKSVPNNDMIDPVKGSLVYKTPSIIRNLDNYIFGIPIAIMPEVIEPENESKVPLLDPNLGNRPKIEAHKRDKYWRRRGMKHHRYLRWRKRNETLLAHKETAKQKKKEIKVKNEIANIWKAAGLEQEPPDIPGEERETLEQQWKRQGIWSSALTSQEIFTFATPPEPKNKKTLPVKVFKIPR
ncbi:uncharacterized protein LOC120329087 [Styela clava]|uniref:uncharacterized protein LOC120329086 n=1 Tax=Styela clava TaxID=7725 RepID=UPI00193A7CF5|nr:uncharacterized protein LOC120329086 [Styela clava]